jgi:hypothetical protein
VEHRNVTERCQPTASLGFSQPQVSWNRGCPPQRR